MKLNKWLYGVTALAMLAACSDKDIAPGGGENENWLQNTNGVGYLGVTLELPSELETRAADEGDQGNDNFDDGLKEEYNVKNAALLLFVGDEEKTAQFCGAYSLVPDEAFDQPNKDNVTVSFQKAAKVKNPAALKSDGQLWGLALVNYDNEHFKIVTDITRDNYGNLTINKPKINDDGTIATEKDADGDEKTVADNVSVTRMTVGADGSVTTLGMTFDEVRNLITNCDFRKYDDGKLSQIFMTNAPLSDTKGTSVSPSGATIQTLAKLNKDKLKETELEARQNPAGCIFVERALAKITCSSFPTSVELQRTKVTNTNSGVAGYTNETVKLSISSVEWILDNEEPNSFIIRNVADPQLANIWSMTTPNINGSNRWRFIGGTGMNDTNYDSDPMHDGTSATWYRTYWCVDPAYNKDKLFNNQADVENAPFKKCDENSVLYSHENTFNVANQNYKNTTRVVFKVQFSKKAQVKDASGNWIDMAGDCNLYALRGELKSFYLKEDAENMIKRSILGSSTLHDLIVDLMPEGTKSLNYKAEDFVIDFGYADKDNDDLGIVNGDYIVKRIIFTDAFKEQLVMSKKSSSYIESQLKDVAETANAANHIVPFTNNTCYYAAYIQHFGKTYCPLSDETTDPTTWTGDRTNVVYGTDDAASVKYLGRYGLVRNNWYDLQVSIIENLGKATVPNGNAETSDDNNEEEYYISARVHVLSWAKRTQGVKF